MIRFPPLALLGGGAAGHTKAGPARNVRATRSIEPLRWDERTTLSAVLDGVSEQFEFRGTPAGWVRYEPRNENEVELVIGLDFGTTLSKVVVSEPSARRSWVVPLSSNSSNPYLLRSEIYLEDKVYNLDRRGEVVSGLKMPLLVGCANQDDINNMTAFLGLVIRYVQQWMLNVHGAHLRGAEPIWLLNVGLPAKDFQDKALIKR